MGYKIWKYFNGEALLLFRDESSFGSISIFFELSINALKINLPPALAIVSIFVDIVEAES